MRKLQHFLLCVIFAMLVIGAGATQSDPCLVYNSETVAVVFDDIYTTAIPPITFVKIDVEVLSSSGVPVVTWQLTTGWTLSDGAWKIPIRSLAATLANGDYKCRLRAWDAYGNVSPWSVTMWVSKKWIDIPAPGGCRTVS